MKKISAFLILFTLTNSCYAYDLAGIRLNSDYPRDFKFTKVNADGSFEYKFDKTIMDDSLLAIADIDHRIIKVIIQNKGRNPVSMSSNGYGFALITKDKKQYSLDKINNGQSFNGALNPGDALKFELVMPEAFSKTDIDFIYCKISNQEFDADEDDDVKITLFPIPSSI